MDVKVLKIDENSVVEAKILNVKTLKINLPTLTDGWHFNFRKHSKITTHITYILTCEETPLVIEGCLIFEMRKKVEPYMAYIEVAPHNKGVSKKYDKVAGCLIAFACRLSFIEAKDPFKGYLVFDVLEENKVDEVKLMKLYAAKYNALKYGDSTMIIKPEGGEKLINEFLK